MNQVKKLIWLCVDSNGDEKLSTNKDGWIRFFPSVYKDKYSSPEAYKASMIERKKCISYNDIQMDYDHWIEAHITDYVPRTGVAPQWNYLPKGTIKKILGYDLTWEDSPVKIEED